MNELLKKCLFIVAFLVVTVGVDQISKQMAVEHLRGRPTKNYLGGTVKLLYAENKGAWGGLGSSMNKNLRFVIFIALPIIVLLAVAYYILTKLPFLSGYFWGFNFVLGGGIGNIIDRVLYNYVVDFLFIGFGHRWLSTNIFNFADVFIMIGGILILYLQFLEWREKRREERNS